MSTPKERIAKQRSEMPSKHRKLYDKVMSGKASPRKAINMMCLECWGYVKTETATCDNFACPLYAYRPYRKAVKSPRERVESPNIAEKAEEVAATA